MCGITFYLSDSIRRRSETAIRLIEIITPCHVRNRTHILRRGHSIRDATPLISKQRYRHWVACRMRRWKIEIGNLHIGPTSATALTHWCCAARSASAAAELQCCCVGNWVVDAVRPAAADSESRADQCYDLWCSSARRQHQIQSPGIWWQSAYKHDTSSALLYQSAKNQFIALFSLTTILLLQRCRRPSQTSIIQISPRCAVSSLRVYAGRNHNRHRRVIVGRINSWMQRQ